MWPSASLNDGSSGVAPSWHAVATPIHSPGQASCSHGRSPVAVRRQGPLIDAAEATRNPWALSYALFAYGFAFLDADPVGALEALRRGLVIAQDSGNRGSESRLATIVAGSRSVPHECGVPRAEHRDCTPARGPRRPTLRIARSQGRDDEHHR